MSKLTTGHIRPTIANSTQKLSRKALRYLTNKNYIHPNYDTSLINLNPEGKLK